MRIERAIDAYLDWRRLERDATPRSIDSYRRILWKLAEDYPEVEPLRADDGRPAGVPEARGRRRARRQELTSISVLHSFFDWANVEDLIEVDPSTKIRRPTKRTSRRIPAESRRARTTPRVDSPRMSGRHWCSWKEQGYGAQRSRSCRWADFDMVKRPAPSASGRASDLVLPTACAGCGGRAADARANLAAGAGRLHVHGGGRAMGVAVRACARRKNPKKPASEQALWRMLARVCKRAGVRPLYPHQLRHGFANRFLRESGHDVAALRPLMGHSRIDTTQLYTDDFEMDELARALAQRVGFRELQASSDLDNA